MYCSIRFMWNTIIDKKNWIIFCDDRKLERIKQNSLTSQKCLLVQAFTVSEISWRQGFCLSQDRKRTTQNEFWEKKMKKKKRCVLLFSIIPKKKNPVKFIQRFSADKKGGVMIRKKKGNTITIVRFSVRNRRSELCVIYESATSL